MLVPPFTVMIIKNSRRPITIRVTYPFVVVVLCVLVFALILTVSVVQSFIIPSLPVLSDMRGGDRAATEYVLVESSRNNTDETVPASPAQPDITDLTITEPRNGDIELSFAVTNYTGQSDLYLWLILNPNAVDSQETAIVPRNPMFRGMPVDYRNGIRHLPAENKKLRFTFSGPTAGSDVDQFRIVAYSLGGEIIIDKTITFQQNIRM